MYRRWRRRLRTIEVGCRALATRDSTQPLLEYALQRDLNFRDGIAVQYAGESCQSSTIHRKHLIAQGITTLAPELYRNTKRVDMPARRHRHHNHRVAVAVQRIRGHHCDEAVSLNGALIGAGFIFKAAAVPDLAPLWLFRRDSHQFHSVPSAMPGFCRMTIRSSPFRCMRRASFSHKPKSGAASTGACPTLLLPGKSTCRACRATAFSNNKRNAALVEIPNCRNKCVACSFSSGSTRKLSSEVRIIFSPHVASRQTFTGVLCSVRGAAEVFMKCINR